MSTDKEEDISKEKEANTDVVNRELWDTMDFCKRCEEEFYAAGNKRGKHRFIREKAKLENRKMSTSLSGSSLTKKNFLMEVGRYDEFIQIKGSDADYNRIEEEELSKKIENAKPKDKVCSRQ